ncbi:hypothetical protein [Streptodolium elevatio]
MAGAGNETPRETADLAANGMSGTSTAPLTVSDVRDVGAGDSGPWGGATTFRTLEESQEAGLSRDLEK